MTKHKGITAGQRKHHAPVPSLKNYLNPLFQIKPKFKLTTTFVPGEQRKSVQRPSAYDVALSLTHALPVTLPVLSLYM